MWICKALTKKRLVELSRRRNEDGSLRAERSNEGTEEFLGFFVWDLREVDEAKRVEKISCFWSSERSRKAS